MSVVVAVVVIFVSCVGYGGGKSFFKQLFLSKILLSELIVFWHLKTDFTIFFRVHFLSVSRKNISLTAREKKIVT